MAHANEELARREVDAAQRGDVETMLGLYADDVVFHYPGRNVLSGTHRGRRDGRTARWNAAFVMHVTDGKISEIWGHIDDSYAVDGLLV